MISARRGVRVEFRAVTKQYGAGPVAVDGLSLRIEPGEVCAIVGPSGSGKTTILKMVNRLVEPTRGLVLVDDDDVATVGAAELRRHTGYVIQQVGLFPHRTVRQNVATVPRLLGWPDARVRTRVDELLKVVGLDPAEVGDRYPAQLSGGQQQRVGVARAVVAEPPLLLMDEPFGAVDPVIRKRLQDGLLALQREMRMTILIVTHDIDEAIKLGDRVAVLREGGRLAQYAAPAALLAHPRDDFVRQFVGSDRALKRLSLVRVDDAPWGQAPIAHLGDSGANIRDRAQGASFVLTLDGAARPVGWVATDSLAASEVVTRERVDPSSPLLHPESTLRDALSALLASSVRTGVLVDHDGRYRGVLTLDMIGAALDGAGGAGTQPVQMLPAFDRVTQPVTVTAGAGR
jgi:osmoprotectant transport system ATP-binding protein